MPGFNGIVGVCIPEDPGTSISGTSPPDTGEVDSTPPDTSADNTGITSDSGTTTQTSSDAESSTEGPPSPCGNGRLEDGEVCDDGNTESGDGCNADCQPGGQEMWSVHFDGGVQLEDWGHRVTTDADDNVIVVGLGFDVGNTQRDGLVIKYDDDGQELWSDRYEGGESLSTDFFWGVATTPDQSVVVTGSSTTVMGQQPMVRMYDADGGVVWTHFEPNAGEGYAYDVVVDSLGDIVVTGYVHDPDTFAPRAWLAKFAVDGDLIWNLRLTVPVGNGAVVLARDSSDALVMAGGDGLIWLRKLDADGDEIWTWTDTPGGNSGLRGAAVRPDDDILVAGTYLDNPLNAYVARHPSTGDDPLWFDGWIGNLGGSAFAGAVASDSTGRPVVAGGHYGNPAQGIYVRKYDGDGEPVWLHEIDGEPNGYDYANGVTVDTQDNVIVSGRRRGEFGNYDVFVRKLTP